MYAHIYVYVYDRLIGVSLGVDAIFNFRHSLNILKSTFFR